MPRLTRQKNNMTGIQVIQVAFWIIGTVNVFVMFALNRGTKRNDEHNATHKDVEKRLGCLENQRITEERFRQIIREELQGFELRLTKEGRLDKHEG